MNNKQVTLDIFHREDEKIEIGDVVSTTTSEFDYNGYTGNFETTETYTTVICEKVGEDYTNYDPSKCRNGGAYGFDYYEVIEILPRYVTVTITSKDDERFELKFVIDINTIDDDVADIEYEQNDGTWSNQLPSYCKIDGEDLTDEYLYEFLPLIEWDFVNQFIVDAEDNGDGIEHNGLIIGVDK